jgi:hypothetical protein
MIIKLSRNIVFKALNSIGYSNWSANELIKALKKDIFSRDTSISQKIWAYRRGFLSTRLNDIGINKDNYKSYMPDFYYYKLHPINGEFSKFIDDKLTMKYVFSKYDEHMPEYYFIIDRSEGCVSKLMDAPKDVEHGIEGIIELLIMKKRLALKLIGGSWAEGFYKISYCNDEYSINDNNCSNEELRIFLNKLRGYIITEYLTQNQLLNNVYDRAPATLRVVMANNKGDINAIGAYMRFPTAKTGVVNNYSAGAVLCGVEIEEGIMFKPKMLMDGKSIDVSVHPDTHEKIDFKLPMWELIMKKLTEISERFPQLIYMGYDIIITDSTFKIIEINSLTALTALPLYYPMLEGKSKLFFLTQFQKKDKHFKKIINDIKLHNIAS